MLKNSINLINGKDKSILLSGQSPFFSLIWLHGLGDSPAGFLDFFQLKYSSVFKGARVKLLQAPQRKVTINGGMKMNSWYDIRSLAGNGKQQQRYNMQQVKQSMSIIDQHVKQQISFWKNYGIKQNDQIICKRIFVGGFSQGCAMSLCYGLNSQRVLAGVVGFSGHLFSMFPMQNIQKIPLLVYHGDSDDVLRYEWVQNNYNKYLKGKPNFKFTLIKDLYHSVTQDQLKWSTEWMLQQLKKNGIINK